MGTAEFFKEFVNIVMRTFGVSIILLALIICLVFFVWVIKLEFDWFFDTDLFKWLENLSLKFKSIFKKKGDGVHKTVDFINKKKHKVILNEEMK